ncbi:MAG: hypothetical protein GXO39_07390 [Thermotogae bacterium]|nr:hypothetical protein [Thermotogota bacterium]
MILLLCSSTLGMEMRLSDMLIGKSVSGYTASRRGRVFDEVGGVIFVSRPHLLFRLTQPFSPCSDLKTIYGEQPADVRLLATSHIDGDISLLAWSRTFPDRIVVFRLNTRLLKDTLKKVVPSLRLEMIRGRVIAKDTTYTLNLYGENIECNEKDVRVFQLGKNLKDPTFVWTGREIWVLENGEIYAYRGGQLIKIYDLKDAAQITSNGEDLVAVYLPSRDELILFDHRRKKTEKLTGISRDVRGEFKTIRVLREIGKGEGEALGGWVVVLVFSEEGSLRYVKVKRNGKEYMIETVDP